MELGEAKQPGQPLPALEGEPPRPRHYVEVDDGKGFVWDQQYCGASIPGPFTSTDTITVKFHTDGVVYDTSGFLAVVCCSVHVTTNMITG